MVQSMKVIMNMEKSMEPVLSNGPIAPNILVNFITIIYMERGSILGVMEEDMKENGKTTKCMVKEHSLGLMVGNTLENTSMIKSKAMVSLFGLMEDHTKGIGLMENNMEREFM